MEVIKSQGNAAFTKGDFTKAIELYRKALALVSERKDAAALHSNMSASLLKLDRYEEVTTRLPVCKPQTVRHQQIETAVCVTDTPYRCFLQALEEASECTEANPEWSKVCRANARRGGNSEVLCLHHE